MDRIEVAIEHIKSARSYTLSLLEDLDEADWFWQPSPAITHIAWQVGHMAMAQYGLTLFRQRGRESDDRKLMSNTFRKRFFKGTTPGNAEETGFTVEVIRGVFDRVYEQALKEIPTFSDEVLDTECEMPYAGFPTNFGSLLFAADHEMLHAGQIGLLRRLMGKEPVR